MKKRLLSLLLAVMVVASCLTIGAAAVTTGEVVTTLDSIMGQSEFTPGYKGGRWQKNDCKVFVNAVCQQLFGETAPTSPNGYILEDIASFPNWKLIGTRTGSNDAVLELLKQAQPGDVIQFKSTAATWQHTSMVYNVTDSTISIYEFRNPESGVTLRNFNLNTLTNNPNLFSTSGVGSFTSSSYGLSVYRHNSVGSGTPVDPTPSKPAAPDANVVAINYASETISYDSSMYEVSATTSFGSIISSGGSISSLVGSISDPIYVRVKQNGNTPASDATKVTLPGRSSFIPMDFVNYSDETFASTSDMEYSLNESSWTKCTGPTPISAAGSNSKIYFRYAATATAFASSSAEVAVPTRSTAPSADVVTIDYANETISFDAAYEVNTAADFSGSAIVSGGAIQPGSSVYVRTKATDSALASDSAQVSVPARPAAPEVTAVDETIDGKADGQITGVSAAMEYRAASGSWAACEGESVTGLDDGVYQVRSMSTESSFASEAASVTVGKGVPATYTLGLEIAEIETEIYNYAQPEGSALMLTSSGNSRAEIVSVTVDDTEAFEVVGSGQYVEAGGSLSSYIVRPRTGLEAGDYTATVTVTYKGGESYSGDETFTVEADIAFTVEKAPQAAPKAPELYKRELNSITLKALSVNANGAQPEYRVNGGAWQTSPVFEDLKAGTSYTFEQRYAAVGSYLASEPSAAAEFTTVFPFFAETHDINISETVNGTVKSSLPNSSSGAKIILTVTPHDGYSLGSLRVVSEEGNSMAVVRDKDGCYSFTMPDCAVTVYAEFTDVSARFPFLDVPPTAWYCAAVSYVYANGLMEGVSDTAFEPGGGMTRAMVWAILARVDGVTVTGSNWADTARSWAVAKGVSDGENASAPVTREQLVTMLYRYAGEPVVSGSLTGWADAASVSGWAGSAMTWAVNRGIITGATESTLAPADGATRAQCAAILMRYVEA